MNDWQLLILQHSLGLDNHGHGKAYRNHFNVDGGADQDTCESLVAAGMMVRQDVRIWPGATFVVTPAGETAVRTLSPKPPALPRRVQRSKSRYLAWLDSTAEWESFGDYLKFQRYRRSEA